MMSASKPKIAFFGTPGFAVDVLEGLKGHGIVPDLIVTAPDAPKGRKLVMTPPDAKVWAERNGVPVLQPEKIRDKDGGNTQNEAAFIAQLKKFSLEWDLFIVAAYGKIIPESILYLPRKKTINVHPSLLPQLRGSSPLQTAILKDIRDTGVTIMRLDAEMDHGPILAQQRAQLTSWPIDHAALGTILARDGAAVIARILPLLLDGTLSETEQNHAAATYTEKIKKEDGLIDLSADEYKNFLRYNAYRGWPGSYFFDANGKRVTVVEAAFEDNAFAVKKVIPEGKKEMTWQEYQRSLR